jgi:hypothetical protein
LEKMNRRGGWPGGWDPRAGGGGGWERARRRLGFGRARLRDGPQLGHAAERGGGHGGEGQLGRELGLFHLFPILFLSFVLFYSFHHFKSNSLLNGCSTKSPIQQNKSMLRHDTKLEHLLRFYFTKLTHLHIDTKQNIPPLFRQKKRIARKREGNTRI